MLRRAAHIFAIMLFLLFLLVFGTWAHVHLTTVRVKDDPTSETDLAAAKAEAQDLLAALEKYRGDTGLYPVSLDQLNGRYLSSVGQDSPGHTSPARSFRYSARTYDWVYKSDACKEREKTLNGWILKNVNDYKKEVADFKHDCLSGYRSYQLQSRDFPRDAAAQNIERWAYYDSSNRQWSLGWCSQDSARHSRRSAMAENGLCRSQQRNDPW
jgi:hypothetical protein